MSVNSKLKIYFPNLDGLRFFCFLAVFFFHSFGTNYDSIRNNAVYKFVKYGLFANGNLGVNFFFVLSGFLITYLLLAEKITYGKINIPGFYMRRMLRIWPLFYFCVFFGFFIFPILKQLNHETPNETAHIIYYLTFLNNFDFIKSGLPDASMLGVLWSVAIEEQFYLVWPLILTIIPAKRYDVVFVVIIMISFIFRYQNAGSPILLEHHTLSCISDLSLGGLAAFLIFRNNQFRSAIENAPVYFWAIVYVFTAIIFFGHQYIFHGSPLLLAADRLVISVIFALIILEQSFAKHALYQMHNLKWATKLGTYTYGLYCLHFFSILIVAKSLARLNWNKTVFQVLVVEGLSSLALTIVIATLSYRYFELPFLKLKSRFSKIARN